MALAKLAVVLRGPRGVVIANPKKLEHGFRRIGARFPFSFV